MEKNKYYLSGFFRTKKSNTPQQKMRIEKGMKNVR